MENNNYSVQGEVEEILPLASGLSKNGFWSSRSFVLTTKGKHENKLFFTCWQEATRKLILLHPGDVVEVSFYINSKKNKGHWYPDLLVTDIKLESKTSNK
jgi:hypothetical protein